MILICKGETFHDTQQSSDITQLLSHCWTITVLQLARQGLSVPTVGDSWYSFWENKELHAEIITSKHGFSFKQNTA